MGWVSRTSPNSLDEQGNWWAPRQPQPRNQEHHANEVRRRLDWDTDLQLGQPGKDQAMWSRRQVLLQPHWGRSWWPQRITHCLWVSCSSQGGRDWAREANCQCPQDPNILYLMETSAELRITEVSRKPVVAICSCTDSAEMTIGSLFSKILSKGKKDTNHSF